MKGFVVDDSASGIERLLLVTVGNFSQLLLGLISTFRGNTSFRPVCRIGTTMSLLANKLDTTQGLSPTHQGSLECSVGDNNGSRSFSKPGTRHPDLPVNRLKWQAR